jgi:hypothetical protein
VARRHPCDCCGKPRRPVERLCDACFRALPNDLRWRLISAFRTGNLAGHRVAKKEAKAFMARRLAVAVTAQQAYARNAAMLGERD